MVDHNIVRLDVAMHDSIGVSIIERLYGYGRCARAHEYVKGTYAKELVDIIPNVVVAQRGVEDLEVGVLHKLKDERGSLRRERCKQKSRHGMDQRRTFECSSRTTSSSLMMLGPPYRFCKILISRLIFFFFTGFRILMMHLRHGQDMHAWLGDNTSRCS